jgi:dipeptidase
MTWAAKGTEREKRSRALLSQKKKRLTTKDFINILRDHGDNPRWTPNRCPGATLCLHAADKLFHRTQTVCSLIAKIGEDGQFFYTTGASNPCISPFFLIFSPATTVPAEYSEGSENYNSKSYWWESERFHRKALLNFNSAQVKIQPLIINYEDEIISSIENSLSTLNQKQINEYFIRARTIIKNWGSKLDRLPLVNLGWSYSHYWRGIIKGTELFEF